MKTLNLPDHDIILKKVKSNGFVFFEDVLNHSDFNFLRNFWHEYFKNLILKKPKSSNVFGASQRLGDRSYSSYKKDRKVYMYRHKNYIWDEPLNELTVSIAKQLHEIRNYAIGLDKDHGLKYNSKREAFYTQVNLYPKDGGYLLPHTDGRSDYLMLNCMFSLTFKPEDFDKGGLYVIINNKKIDLDKIAKPNSVLFFDGNLTHGIDPVFSKNQDSLGRLAIFPMIQFFLNSSTIPWYLKFLIQADISLKRRLKLKNRIPEGNSQKIDK
tara:strand:+ start:60 stop:863 length:804 start_codon:yes stop_codon:yes gene_type:complete